MPDLRGDEGFGMHVWFGGWVFSLTMGCVREECPWCWLIHILFEGDGEGWGLT